MSRRGPNNMPSVRRSAFPSSIRTTPACKRLGFEAPFAALWGGVLLGCTNAPAEPTDVDPTSAGIGTEAGTSTVVGSTSRAVPDSSGASSVHPLDATGVVPVTTTEPGVSPSSDATGPTMVAPSNELGSTSASTAPVTVSPSGAMTLKQAGAAAGRLIGVAVDESALANDLVYQQLAAAEFDYVTPENATKWEPLAPSSTTYDWVGADSIMQFAQEHQQAFKGHTFIWYMQNPAWLEGLSADELRAAMRNHIRTTMERYKGKVRAWDVVNESVDTDAATGYRENVFWQVLGPGYIEEAFRYADEVRAELDPNVLLFYNEIGIERIGAKSNFAYQLMKDLLDIGVPIDGIGFQSHVSTHRYPSESDLRANLRRFAELGLSINISEADVRDTVLPGSPEVQALAQQIAYQQIVASCVLEPACEAITFWGFTDKYSWLLEEGAFKPLLFTADYQKKPSYQGVLDGLAGKLPVRGVNIVEDSAFAAGAPAWSASGGQLTVQAVEGREGNAGCVASRTGPLDGVVQNDLLAKVALGPQAFSAWVFASEASNVDASLLIQEEGAEAVESNIATTRVEAGVWTALTGYLGIGFAGTPQSLGLKIHGPEANVTLCVADVALQALTVQ